MRDVGIHNVKRALPRMTWTAKNLFNLWQRSGGGSPALLRDQFTNNEQTLFKQRWESKTLVRAYHGDYITERSWRRWFMLDTLPNVRPKNAGAMPKGDSSDLEQFAQRRVKEEEYAGEEKKGGLAPVGSLMFSELERRIDVFVFRCCFAHSIYEARRLVIHGHVLLNGKTHSNANTRLTPGDMISVLPSAIRYFKPPTDENFTDVLAAMSEYQRGERRKEQQKAHAAVTDAETQTERERRRTHRKEREEIAMAHALEQAKDEAERALIAEGKLVPNDLMATLRTLQDEDARWEARMYNKLSPEERAAKEAKELGLDDQEAKPTFPLAEETEAEIALAAQTKAEKALQDGARTPFYLPDFASPWLFIPAYIEVNFATCSAVYVRHPTARPGYSEIPTPYDAAGDVIRFAWEYYTQMGRRVRSKTRIEQMPEDRDWVKKQRTQEIMQGKVLAAKRKKDKQNRRTMSGVIL
ncbi:alpha-L RNA-binding motif-containing protein [Cylindrobasidium torrendii FP15055 ss-10]|uniref:Alpha-L RNA-binding motif-containing protein n=1 Tax=Cylindrobasidium torrendii FP15055 ss-10 TaxID=1314674 RepID=A0A0D7AVW7_9AGAR|nr:alpha-L RNA-binding motif-containing protein [Cylindrobasidium torrendii FP15055 ss-10]